jgi:pimeloyl-ACP methyl ester carboxylesterase
MNQVPAQTARTAEEARTAEAAELGQVASQDGTRIAYERRGEGAPVILVMGAFNDRHTGDALADYLAADFTVYTYDRRGRGESGDTAPYAVEREIEDLGAVIEVAGGEAAVFGYSSGAVLALRAAASGLPITRLAVYDAPFDVDEGRPQPAVPHAARLAELVAAGRRGDAVEYFQGEMVGLPKEAVAQLRHAPFRPGLEQMAHTLVYEATILGDGSLPQELGAVRAPTLTMDGGDFGSGGMRRAAEAVAASVRDGRHLSLEEQHHQIVPEVIGPALGRFFGGDWAS